MKAQVLRKYDPEMKEGIWVANEEMPDPKIEKASDVIVKIGAAGVCRTDLHIIEGVWKHIQDPDGKLLPCVMGHENAGWIEDVGKDVTEFKKGDPVILHPLISGTDGTCLDCRRGNDMHAAAGAFPGLSIKEGGYSELLKTSVRNLIKLPKVLAPKDVAPFSDAGLTAYRVVKKATRHLLPGQSCTIIGAGGLGHIAIQCLKAMCAADIIIVEKSEKALKHAMELGGDHGVLIDGNENGLVGYWQIDEGSGNITGDSTDAMNDASISGATWIIQDSPIEFKTPIYDTGVIVGSAYQLRARVGTNDFQTFGQKDRFMFSQKFLVILKKGYP